MNADSYFEDPSVVRLARAVQRSDVSQITEIVRSGVSPDSLGRQGETLLWWALRTNQKRAFQTLLELALDFDGDPNVAIQGGVTALFSALSSFEPGHMHLLLAAGAEIDHRDAAGETAMLKPPA